MCNYRKLILLSLVSIFYACSLQKKNISKNEERRYYEDLSFVRINSKNDNIESVITLDTININNNISKELDSVLSIIIDNSKKNLYIDGFSIQLYLGDNRSDADSVIKKIKEIDSLIYKNTVFTQPNYRVKVGKFIDRFDANKEFLRFKKNFPNAIIIPEKIKFN